MSKALVAAAVALVGVLAAVGSQHAEIRRYLKIKQM